MKLDKDKVEQIRITFSAGGISQKALAAKYGVSNILIGKILRGQIWKDAAGPITATPNKVRGKIVTVRKLTDPEIVQIKQELAAEGADKAAIASKFNISISHVEAIKAGTVWSDKELASSK